MVDFVDPVGSIYIAAVATILVSAGVAKAWQPQVAAMSLTGLLGRGLPSVSGNLPNLFVRAFALVEIALGLSLYWTPFRPIAMSLAAGAFFGFAALGRLLARAGQRSCGCLGSTLGINVGGLAVWLNSAIAVVLVGFLMLWRSSGMASNADILHPALFPSGVLWGFAYWVVLRGEAVGMSYARGNEPVSAARNLGVSQ